MIDDGKSQDKYVEIVNSIHQDLKHFQNVLYGYLYNTEYYNKICAISNQVAHFFATTKTHKFNKIGDINIQYLKLRSTIDQTGTYIYNASKVTGSYFKLLAKNNFTISDTLFFSNTLRSG